MEVGTKGPLTLPIALHLHGMYIRSKVLELPIIVRGILLVSKWAARSVLPVGCKVLLRRGLTPPDRENDHFATGNACPKKFAEEQLRPLF